MTIRHTRRKATTQAGSRRKGKRTFSLSIEALAYLDTLAEQHNSTSEALDRLIREKKNEAEKTRISAGIRSYYDSISDDDRADNMAWGKLAGSHFLKD
jgi:hypothetical protein